MKRWFALVLGLLLLVGLGACKGEEAPASSAASAAPQSEPEPDPNWPAQVGELTLESQPQQVISLSPALTELVYELEGEALLAGVSSYCDYPKEALDLPDCGSALLPDRETIQELAPQLVLASAPLSPEDTQWLAELGAQVLVVERADSVDGIGENYRMDSTALYGKEAGPKRAEEVFGQLEARYLTLQAAAQGVTQPVSGIYLRQAPLVMATGDTLEGELLEAIGVSNDAAAYSDWQYPADQAVNLYPDLVFYAQEIGEAYFATTQIYSTTDAYLQGRLYPVDPLPLERQSGRMWEVLEGMFQAAYPELGGR